MCIILYGYNWKIPIRLTPFPTQCTPSRKGPEILKVLATKAKLGPVKSKRKQKHRRKQKMSLVLARIDQRLIHGIVVTQWAGATQAKRLMVVDDEVSKDEVQKSAMRMSKPVGTGMSIIDTETAIKNFNAGKYDSHNVFMIVREPSTLVKLAEGGVKIPKVNIGIIFDGEGKTTVKKMVSVNEEEVADLKKLKAMGIPVTFHFVPSEAEEPLETYIK